MHTEENTTQVTTNLLTAMSTSSSSEYQLFDSNFIPTLLVLEKLFSLSGMNAISHGRSFMTHGQHCGLQSIFMQLLWCRNGISQLSILTEIPQTMTCLLTSTPPPPAAEWRGKFEIQKGKALG